MKKKLFLTVLCAVGLLSFTACSDDEPNNGKSTERKDIVLSRAEENLVNGQSEFAYKLFATALGESAVDKNVVFSPYSLSGALAMTVNAAEGQVASEIVEALGCNVEDIEAMNGLYKSLTASLLKADKQVDLTISNSAWLDPKYEFVKSFKNTIASYYNAKAYKADLRTQNGIDMFNKWCSEESNGLIKKVLNQPEELDLAITNVTAFHGKWKTPFDKDLTHKAPFKNADSSKSNVSMMRLADDVAVYEGANYLAVVRPYGNGSFRMKFILPNEDSNVDEVAGLLTVASVKEAFANYAGNYYLQVPKFKTTYDNDALMGILEKLGMPTAMNVETSVLSNLATFNDKPVDMRISKVFQNVMVEVDESGATAAAVSAVEGGLTSAGPKEIPTLTFDRPFIFIIDEVSTGSILFMGAINKL